MQYMIAHVGWRTACWTLGVVLLVALAPINLLLRKRPEDMGLLPDGDLAPHPSAPPPPSNIVDAAWAATDWTLPRAVRTARFWWLALGYFCALYVWYAVQVHQTKYLTEIGVSPTAAAWALGFVSLAGIPGGIVLGHLSDRIGREWVWAIANLGFAFCFLALLALGLYPSVALVYAMVIVQGVLGYGLTSVMGAIVAEIFQGAHFGTIFGSVMVSALAGGAAGPWFTGVLHDLTGDYVLAFWLGVAVSGVSALAVWRAAPRKVRAVAGRIRL
jgi:MFS family permease